MSQALTRPQEARRKEGAVSPAAPELGRALRRALREHDRRCSEVLPIWWGAEPTFTDRFSESPQWLCEALGEDKEARARQLLRRLLEDRPGALAMRPLGRKYGGEPVPRWCYGIWARRDGSQAWSGPPDRLGDGEPSPERIAATAEQRRSMRARVVEALKAAGWWAAALDTTEPGVARVVCRPDGSAGPCTPEAEPRLLRPSAHGTEHGPRQEPVDSLASDGIALVLIHAGAGGADNDAWVELPTLPGVESFANLLGALEQAARAAGVEGLGLRGFAPPVDSTVAWTTLTADPAVLEVNQAPMASLEAFYDQSRRLFEVAESVGLRPYRLQYDGTVSDSGGGGQMTAGGPSPLESPFFVEPQLLPRLIRYFTAHPSLSYWFATKYVGGSSQSPRPDEGDRQSFLELQVGLEQLERIEQPSPDCLWGTLRHFLADSSGNPHRSEMNIEKLFNPHLPDRGKLGLVEFRALSMPRSAEISAARALLLRSLVAMLAARDSAPPLRDWGDELHDRFALPAHLEQDLREVLGDLERAGLPLAAEVRQLLLDRGEARLSSIGFEGCELQLDQAVEFWPLVGDVASQEQGSSRVVDASTARLQVTLRAPTAEALAAVRVSANGWLLPMRGSEGSCERVMGLRYRSFVPWSGLHPSLPAQMPVLRLHGQAGRALEVTVHSWRPDGQAYPGLPECLEEAAERRAERVVATPVDPADAPVPREPPPAACTPHCLDLRRVPVVEPSD